MVPDAGQTKSSNTKVIARRAEEARQRDFQRRAGNMRNLVKGVNLHRRQSGQPETGTGIPGLGVEGCLFDFEAV